jgi:hypothetical protein
MDNWAPLWSSIVDSSLWEEPDYVVKVFLTMLALKDSDHIYRGTAFRLSKRSNKPELEVLDALKILSMPDARRKEHQEFDGRRIKAVEDGWLILNGDKYRQKVRSEMTRMRNLRAQQAFRDRKKNGTPLPGEETFVRTGVTPHEFQ